MRLHNQFERFTCCHIECDTAIENEPVCGSKKKKHFFFFAECCRRWHQVTRLKSILTGIQNGFQEILMLYMFSICKLSKMSRRQSNLHIIIDISHHLTSLGNKSFGQRTRWNKMHDTSNVHEQAPICPRRWFPMFKRQIKAAFFNCPMSRNLRDQCWHLTRYFRRLIYIMKPKVLVCWAWPRPLSTSVQGKSPMAARTTYPIIYFDGFFCCCLIHFNVLFLFICVIIIQLADDHFGDAQGSSTFGRWRF